MKHLNDQDLLLAMDNLVQQERELLTAVLAHLREIERRRLFCDLGFPSLFAYAVEKLGYSHDQAFRRITAMRLLKELPELREKLESGILTLTNLSMAATLFRREKQMTVEQKREFLKKLENRSSRETEQIIAAASPRPHTPDRVKPTSENSVEIRFTAPAELLEKIDRLKGLLAHAHPGISLAELFEKLADLGLKEWDPGKPPKRERKTRETSPEASKDKPPHMANNTNQPNQPERGPLGSTKTKQWSPIRNERTISITMKRGVWKRDQGKCQNCDSKYALEVDHIRPIALGGDSSPENLRLLCKSCNQRAAIQKLGMKPMEKYL